NNHETLNTLGTTTLVQGSTVRTANGGILAPSNAILAHRDDFAVIPEVKVNVGVELSRNIRAYVGYSFLYWEDVARPGDSSRAVNASQVPSSLSFGAGLGTPAQNKINGSDFYAHGLNVGLAIRY